MNLRYRGAGSGNGPNAYVWTPPVSLADGGSIAALNTIAQYGVGGAGNYVSDYNERNMYQGLAWVVGSSKSGVLVAGLKEAGDPTAPHPSGYYGYANWALPGDCEHLGTCVGERGHRAANPKIGWWMFDPAEYESVLASTQQAHEVDYYAFDDQFDAVAYRTDIAPTFLVTGTTAEMPRMTYDFSGRRLFVSECFSAPSASGAGLVPVIHVFSVA
jgi:hypothetical protein